ncbi:MAG TPA: tRNA uridine-5-carboxymethylaminomethyl(34) synthesis GTPase MnmE [Methyloceanibacter sp.]|nr:tRNA uridine-5-carboxymethylaminomethyl(34) synthesis GTPase MnmE [Methyloceanibacter sp.]
MSNDTIIAPASGAGRAAIAVIRVSGAGTRALLEALCGGAPPPRHASLREIGPPARAPIDRGLVLWFPKPASFTGEDMAELHVHGSRAVVREVIDAMLALPGTRLAEPGEFARRAFENGKLDLTQVEGLADLIDAETEAQRRQALAQAEGALRALYESWRDELLRAQALMEAGLDFSDEADVAADAEAKAEAIVANLREAIARHLADRSGERLREGLRVVIAGAPNAGKSSLLNLIAKRDVAIVSEEAGTTRDVIEVHLDLGGIPVILADTAGLREAEGTVERIGIDRALARVEAADLVLWVVDATAPMWNPPPGILPVKSAQIGANPAAIAAIAVLNKIDLAPGVGEGRDVIEVSAKTGQGIDRLIAVVEERAASAAGSGAGGPLLTRSRHRLELEAAASALQRFDDRKLSPELKAEELRIAAHHLGRLTGRIDVEEVLGAIFAEFCIGK